MGLITGSVTCSTFQVKEIVYCVWLTDYVCNLFYCSHAGSISSMINPPTSFIRSCPPNVPPQTRPALKSSFCCLAWAHAASPAVNASKIHIAVLPYQMLQLYNQHLCWQLLTACRTFRMDDNVLDWDKVSFMTILPAVESLSLSLILHPPSVVHLFG